ncbi:hypothetical protein EOL94_01165 [bacterium]|nr:hypothetical protein [bacterium]
MKEIIKKIQEIRNNPVLLLNLKEIQKDSALKVHKIFCKKKFEELDIILQTPGGDIDASFLITKILRNRAKKINIIVPLYAKSAGTLMCMGADEIILTDLSELGPLDTQIFEQKDGGQVRYTSALNGFKALEQTQMHAVETMDVATKLILARSRMKIFEAIQLAIEFSAQTSGKLYSNLNPEKIGEYARALEIGEKYGIIILTRYMGWPNELAENTVRTLVKQYPSHGFIIDFEELSALKLPAKKVGDDILDSVLDIRENLLKIDQNIIELFEIEEEKKDKEDEQNKENNKK